MERSNGAVKTAFDLQVDGKCGPGRSKKGKRKVEGVPQLQTAALPRPQNGTEAAGREGLQSVEAFGYRPA